METESRELAAVSRGKVKLSIYLSDQCSKVIPSGFLSAHKIVFLATHMA